MIHNQEKDTWYTTRKKTHAIQPGKRYMTHNKKYLIHSQEKIQDTNQEKDTWYTMKIHDTQPRKRYMTHNQEKDTWYTNRKNMKINPWARLMLMEKRHIRFTEIALASF